MSAVTAATSNGSWCCPTVLKELRLQEMQQQSTAFQFQSAAAAAAAVGDNKRANRRSWKGCAIVSVFLLPGPGV